ncbi:MAG: hypothetical protein OEL76_04530 [Siculibacillus sp.]|nr:hypothetical protein [Siculibacillus sp.]
MPNELSRRRAVRRVGLLPRLRAAPVLLLGLVAVAVVGRAPPTDAPVHWTVRDASGWMAEFDTLRDQRSALIAAASPVAASPRGDRLAAATTAPAPLSSAGASPAPAEVATAPIVVAEADFLPRDERKRVPRDVVDPDITGAVPGVRRPAMVPVEVAPTVNRTGKGDRLLAPQLLGRTTERDLFVKPTLATIPPSQEGWPPLVTVASLIAPQPAETLPRLALAVPGAPVEDGRIVVAMIRTGPGRVVTQSAVAAYGDRDVARARATGRPLLPPVPEAQMAAASPRTRVWTQPQVPEIGYARRTADGILARFRAVLGDEPDPAPKARTAAEEAAEMGP